MPEPQALHRGQLEAVGHPRAGRATTASGCSSCCPTRRRRPADVGLCVPFTALDAVRRERWRARGVLVCAQNMHAEETGAFTGEVSAPMLLELGVDGVVLGHSERRQYDGETDRALQDKVPAALDAGLRPILCVGETEEEREARRDRAQAAPPGAGGARAGARRAAGRGDDRLRADLGDRHRQGGHARAGAGGDRVRARAGGRPLGGGGASAVRVLYGGSVKPDNAAEILAQPDVDGALVGGASLDPDGLRRDRGAPRAMSRARARRAAGAVGLPGDPRRLGPGRARARATRSSWPTRRSSTSSGSATRTRSSRPAGRAVGLPEGQMGNSEVGHLNLGRRRGRAPGPDPHRRRGGGRLVLRERGAARGLRRRQRGRAAAPAGAGVGRRRARQHGPPAGAASSWRAREGVPTWCCTPSPTAATRCPTPAPATWPRSRGGWRGAAAAWPP